MVGARHESASGEAFRTKISHYDNPIQHFEDRVSSYARRTNRETAIRHFPVGCGRGYNLLRAQIAGTEAKALFIGQWVPTLLILGLYNKLVKQLGSHRTSGFGRSLQKDTFL